MSDLAEGVEIHAEQDELLSIEVVRSFIEDEDRKNGLPRLVSDDHESIPLPESLYRVLRAAIPLLLEEQSVAIISKNEELTTQQAAGFLNISRQHLVTLLKAGKIPFHFVGTHRRVIMRDILAYREQKRAEQTQALDDILRLSYDEGMYDKHPRPS